MVFNNNVECQINESYFSYVVSSSIVNVDISVWHSRFRHIGQKRIKMLGRADLVNMGALG